MANLRRMKYVFYGKQSVSVKLTKTSSSIVIPGEEFIIDEDCMSELKVLSVCGNCVFKGFVDAKVDHLGVPVGQLSFKPISDITKIQQSIGKGEVHAPPTIGYNPNVKGVENQRATPRCVIETRTDVLKRLAPSLKERGQISADRCEEILNIGRVEIPLNPGMKIKEIQPKVVTYVAPVQNRVVPVVMNDPVSRIAESVPVMTNVVKVDAGSVVISTKGDYGVDVGNDILGDTNMDVSNEGDPSLLAAAMPDNVEVSYKSDKDLEAFMPEVVTNIPAETPTGRFNKKLRK